MNASTIPAIHCPLSLCGNGEQWIIWPLVIGSALILLLLASMDE